MPHLSRRLLLLGAGSALLAGCSGITDGVDLGSRGACRTPGELVDFDAVGGGVLGYEIGRRTTSMKSEPAFLDLLNTWAEDWSAMSGLGAITQVWSYGAYVDKCSSFHQVGRAFDVAEVVHEGGSVSCRFDQWGPGTAQQLRDYWRLAASLHLHFAYTLTHLYDGAHANHIHVDNSVSGDELSTFRERSQVQVQFVQAALRHVHGAGVELTSTYDDQTRDALRQVQRSLGITRPLGDADGWREFLRLTASAS